MKNVPQARLAQHCLRSVVSPDRCHRKIPGFTLVELLAVLAIVILIMALAGPTLLKLKGAGDVTSAAYDISGLVENARAFALANNTYTWVGFYEENNTALSALPATPSPTPPYPGKGRVIMAAIASKDGTTIVNDSVSGTSVLDPTRFYQINKNIKLENIHLVDIGAPDPTQDPNALGSRSSLPYNNTLQGPFSSQTRISSEGTEVTRRPFVSQGYTFYKTIRFNPRGEAQINSTYTPKRCAEIGIIPTHGIIPDTASKNVVAIQFTGIAGNVKIYRR
ncbi:MAG: prepilin-type N-terminal cleavage/methylation domain-containing protein [Chthoniobacterales bacterium]